MNDLTTEIRKTLNDLKMITDKTTPQLAYELAKINQDAVKGYQLQYQRKPNSSEEYVIAVESLQMMVDKYTK